MTKTQKRRACRIFAELGGTGYLDAAEAHHIALTYGVAPNLARLKYLGPKSYRETRVIDLATFIATHTK